MRAKKLSVLLLATLALASCGGQDRSGELTTNTKALQIVSPADVGRQPVGSPQRAVLRWWRQMQFRNISQSLAAFTPGARAQLQRQGYGALLFEDFGPWAQRTRPRIVSAETPKGHADVELELTVTDPVGLDLVRRSKQYAGITLDRAGPRWLVSDPSFFLQQATALRRARLQAERAQARR
jgi:hypothetical protein